MNNITTVVQPLTGVLAIDNTQALTTTHRYFYNYTVLDWEDKPVWGTCQQLTMIKGQYNESVKYFMHEKMKCGATRTFDLERRIILDRQILSPMSAEVAAKQDTFYGTLTTTPEPGAVQFITDEVDDQRIPVPPIMDCRCETPMESPPMYKNIGKQSSMMFTWYLKFGPDLPITEESAQTVRGVFASAGVEMFKVGGDGQNVWLSSCCQTHDPTLRTTYEPGNCKTGDALPVLYSARFFI